MTSTGTRFIKQTTERGATMEGIEANLHEGVLTVRVPKAQQERPRRIDVKAA
jgi:HSP20 family molecular chaperone IbpA